MALVAGGGLAALLASAEADRRKMRHALREIHLEA
jgi:succinate dehydrogenase/fumarate reductase flavoprotein subunit